MPAAIIPSSFKIRKMLEQLGWKIHARRKNLSISAVATAEAAGISRMTLHRIERGEASVTLGAYLSVISALGLSPELVEVDKKTWDISGTKLPKKIPLQDYPQLKRLAWQLKGKKKLGHKEALDLYERNWRHVDLNKMTLQERQLIRELSTALGRGRLLV